MNELFEKLKIKPKQEQLYNTAFSHSSYANEHKAKSDYERLEFLGDAVVDLVVADYLYSNKKENEGEIEVYEGLAWLEIIARKLGMLGAGDYGKDASVSFEDGALLKVSNSGEILYEICGD